MTDLARGEWRFDGYISSDCGAVAGVDVTATGEGHHYSSNVADTVPTILTVLGVTATGEGHHYSSNVADTVKAALGALPTILAVLSLYSL
jgi:hypothetical protein